jgi:two-component sensor histidine kinase
VLINAPLAILGIALALYTVGDPFKSVVLISIIPIFPILYLILRAGHLRATINTLLVLVNIVVTWSCTTGNGIHDIGIVMFPISVLIAALLLRPTNLIAFVIFSTACLAFLVVGEKTGVYAPYDPYAGRFADVIILGLLLLIGLVTTSSLTKRLKQTMKQRVIEGEVQRETRLKMEQNLEEKHELFREVHHRVKNHLAFINSLIDLETMTHPELDRTKIRELQSKVVAVARVHDQLYHSDKYETVGTKRYLEGIISQFMMTYQLIETLTDMKIDDFELEVGKVIYLGISIHEIISLISLYAGTSKKVEFILTKGTKKTHLTIIFDHHSNQRITDQTEKMELLQFLAGKLNGKLEVVSGEKKALFELEFSH